VLLADDSIYDRFVIVGLLRIYEGRFKVMVNIKKRLAILFCLIFFMVACSQDEKTRTIDTLNIAVLPDQNKSQIHDKYLPLIEYLKSKTGLHIKLLIPQSYKELLHWFNIKKIDLANFGGVTFIEAKQRNNAIPLVMRDVDIRFSSAALVLVSNSANSIQDLKGASLAFGSRLSTSGHFMPRYFFEQKNIIPETFFGNIQYSGFHDTTAEWVRDEKVEVGIVNLGIANEMFLDGRLSHNKVKVIWKSPPFADYVWAIQSDISQSQKVMIRDAFLSINQNPDNKRLLENLGANYFIPAGEDDFTNLDEVVQKIKQQEIVQ